MLMVRTRGLRRTFHNRGDRVEAVSGIDLRVPEGEIFGFLGPEGAGKTTMLRMLATLLPPSGGDAEVVGHDVRTQARHVRERIGYVSRHGGTDRAVTGRGELVFQGRLYGLSSMAARRRAAELLDTLNLLLCADRPIRTYSDGDRRGLDIGVALAHRPRLLFIDEPTADLDPHDRTRLWARILGLRETGTTILVTTRVPEEADALCDRVAIIDRGRIVAEGTSDGLKQELAHDVVTLRVTGDREAALDLLRGQNFVLHATTAIGGEPRDENPIRLHVRHGEEAIPVIRGLLDHAGVRLCAASFSRAGLEEVFSRRTGRSLSEG